MEKKILIFDFDGTIADTSLIFQQTIHKYLKKKNLSWNKLRSVPSSEAMKVLGLRKIQMPIMLRNFRSHLARNISGITLVPGIQDTFKELKKNKYKVYLISSNSKINMRSILEHNNALNEIEGIISTFSIFNKSKAINKLAKQLECSLNDMIYIGDETRDIEAANKAGIKSISVTWGYNSKEILERYNPTYLIESPHELIETLKRFHNILGVESFE